MRILSWSYPERPGEDPTLGGRTVYFGADVGPNGGEASFRRGVARCALHPDFPTRDGSSDCVQAEPIEGVDVHDVALLTLAQRVDVPWAGGGDAPQLLYHRLLDEGESSGAPEAWIGRPVDLVGFGSTSPPRTDDGIGVRRLTALHIEDVAWRTIWGGPPSEPPLLTLANDRRDSYMSSGDSGRKPRKR
jgi:hypothetical protein